jgi:PAS domain S-box-containing protein
MLIERSLLHLWPAFEDSVAGAQIRRAMRMGSSTQTRLTIAGKAAHISAFPWPGGTGLIIRTADEDERAARAAAEVEAIHRLLTLDGQIGMVRLSPRGTMTDADPGFCAITKITADRLAGARLLDLVPRADRAILSDMIENVFNGCREACCSVRILDNDGQEVPAQIAITAIREDLGIGGALIMVRDRRPH